jgi:hypothetical protein
VTNGFLHRGTISSEFLVRLTLPLPRARCTWKILIPFTNLPTSPFLPSFSLNRNGTCKRGHAPYIEQSGSPQNLGNDRMPSQPPTSCLLGSCRKIPERRLAPPQNRKCGARQVKVDTTDSTCTAFHLTRVMRGWGFWRLGIARWESARCRRANLHTLYPATTATSSTDGGDRKVARCARTLRLSLIRVVAPHAP